VRVDVSTVRTQRLGSGTGAEHLDFGFHFGAMACDCEIRIANMPLRTARNAARQAIDEIRRIEAKYSRYRDDSVIAAINRTAGGNAGLDVDHETAELLNFAANLHVLSDGLFDVTSGILRTVWDFRAPRLPSHDDIARVTSAIGWCKVRWDGTRIALPQSGMELDFGGFGKEYAADRAATVLMRLGVVHAIVNLGGDIRAIGARSDGAPWQLGIRHPRQLDGTTASIASVVLTDAALATSGDYERFFELDGKRYCHLLNPRTGWPVSRWQSISVIAPICTAAGALSTIAMLMEARAIEFLKAQSVGFLAIDATGEIVRYEPLNINHQGSEAFTAY
jgi:FAD:protein FMN transferase